MSPLGVSGGCQRAMILSMTLKLFAGPGTEETRSKKRTLNMPDFQLHAGELGIVQANDKLQCLKRFSTSRIYLWNVLT